MFGFAACNVFSTRHLIKRINRFEKGNARCFNAIDSGVLKFASGIFKASTSVILNRFIVPFVWVDTKF